ncbi:MAG: tetratricopeptide repeat protein [Erythrobacter sp.]
MLRIISILAVTLSPAVVGSSSSSAESPKFDPASLAALDPTLPGRTACKGIDASGELLDQRLQLASQLSNKLMFTAQMDEFPLYGGIGVSDIGVTNLSGEARSYFDQGVALLYGFNHAAAVRSFRKARSYEPECAMCWWGEAYANGLNINAGMSEAQNRQAIFAIKQAQRLSGDASPLEKALIAAQAARFPDDMTADRTELERIYSGKMIDVARRFPASNDVAVLAAESAMNTTAWDYWDAETREARPQIATAIGLIEQVMADNPRHPQASHLYIHLMENSPDPTKAEAAADRLVESAPEALGHLVHMPGHIYYRIGRYKDAMTANVKAARADEAYLSVAGDDGLYRFGYYPHNVHFLLTSAQMVGDMHRVANETERLKRILNVEVAKQLPWVQAIHAAPSFAMTQYASPAAVLALNSEPTELEYVQAMRHYAMAVAHARNGNEAGFATSIAAMEERKSVPQVTAMVDAGFPAPDIIELAVHVAYGRQAHAKGDYTAAIGHYEQAQAIEATIPYNEPPYWYYPISQSLGASLYRAGRYRDALGAFREALFKAPNNGWALYGLAKTERKLGNIREARAAEAALEAVWMGEAGWLDLERL